MRVSIVINTYNRRPSLEQTLASLRQLRYRDFEVVVVNGPSSDGTDELLEEWKESVKVLSCPVANLSISRNIGIAAAAGDIVAFIDDDAVPDPQWLGKLVAGYDSVEVGGVGGLVFDSTGYNFQTKYIVCDRFGGAVTDNEFDPTPLFNIPGAPRYTAHIGTNSSFRRSVLIEIGGFDEEFAYYLDETDVCLRAVDRGWVVKYVEDAFVYHKFAPSHLRSPKKSLTTRYEVIKNKTYFALKHGGAAQSYFEAMQAIMSFVEDQRRDVLWCIQNGRLQSNGLETFEDELRRAFHDGFHRALSGHRVYLSRETLNKYARPFKRFDRELIAPDRLTICLFTQDFPPKLVNGIGRALYELSRSLAELGHTVHLLTTSDTHSRVDLEDGVWVHRLSVSAHPRPSSDIPQHIWNYSRTMMDEVERIDKFDRVDVIQAPAWDCEGIAPLLDGRIPLITSLHTPMLIAASMHPDWLVDGERISNILSIIIWERRIMTFSDGVAANSHGIVDAVEREYDIVLNRDRLAVVGHGYHDRTRETQERNMSTELRVLFLGRLEYRKGIDILLEALLQLLPEFPQLRVDIIGEDAVGLAQPYKRKFLDAVAGTSWASNVTFHGRVEDELLDDYFSQCDIFVAPSRFESFGLIYLEAMMHGKPCVGTDIGGIAEVIRNGETGLLVKAGDPEGLVQALRVLVLSDELRARLGAAARQSYLRRFTALTWASRSLEQYKHVVARGARVRHRSLPAGSRIALSRVCDIGEFWVNAPLYPRLSTLGNGTVDWRIWSVCLAVEALAQKATAAPGDRRKALVLADYPIPAIEAYVSGWDIQKALALRLGSQTARPAGKSHRSLTCLGYGSGEFDMVYCLVALDPLHESFAAVLSELARVCRFAGSVHVLVLLGDGIRHRAASVGDFIEQAGLRAKCDLLAFWCSQSSCSGMCDDKVEPYLGVRVAGEDRPLATLELERLDKRQKGAARLRQQKVEAR